MIPCYVKLTVMLTGEPIWINMANKTTMVPSERSGTAILHQGTQVIVREPAEEVHRLVREELAVCAAHAWGAIQAEERVVVNR